MDTEWISAYAEAAARWSDAGYFGGAIEPWYECTPPQWLSENTRSLQGMLVVRDLGEDERYLSESENPYGANMAFRSELLREHRFDPDLGRSGDNGILGDEIMLLETLRSRKIRGVWVPRARVKHFIVKRRMTLGYLWSWNRGAGRTSVRADLSGQVPLVGKTWGGVPRWLIRQAIESWLVLCWKTLSPGTAWVSALSPCRDALGYDRGDSSSQKKREASSARMNEPNWLRWISCRWASCHGDRRPCNGHPAGECRWVLYRQPSNSVSFVTEQHNRTNSLS